MNEQLSLFDLHCDTAYEMLRQNQPLTENSLAVSLKRASVFKRYVQVMALWIDHDLSDEDGWKSYQNMLCNLRKDPAIISKKAVLRDCVTQDGRPTMLLSLEDARILAGDVTRIDQLYRDGVRIITPLWKGETVIGGSHDTDQPLTAFGRTAMERALSLGMLLDVSHASVQSAEELFDLAEQHHRPILATHSDAYTVCPVSRNLRDVQIHRILQRGGIIGLNLYPMFLEQRPTVGIEAVLPHIEHFLALGASDALSLGCDMDGATLPDGINSVGDLPKLADCLLRHNYSESLIHKLFYQNAFAFFQKHLCISNCL